MHALAIIKFIIAMCKKNAESSKWLQALASETAVGSSSSGASNMKQFEKASVKTHSRSGNGPTRGSVSLAWLRAEMDDHSQVLAIHAFMHCLSVL